MNSQYFPFSAVLGLDRVKLALIMGLIDPNVGGILVSGPQGTGKSTVIRAMHNILPHLQCQEGCQFQCEIPSKFEDSEDPIVFSAFICELCEEQQSHPESSKISSKPIPFHTLPLGISDDMLIGGINIEHLITHGKRTLMPGLFAKAHRGILYVDEINLLQDHLVDLLIDVTSTHLNRVERDGFSMVHPSNFTLIGSMNPEEGELRPQIQDRLGLEISVSPSKDPRLRSQITRRSFEFQNDPAEMIKTYRDQDREIARKIENARSKVGSIPIPTDFYGKAIQFVNALGIQSHRAEVRFLWTARAVAAYRGRDFISEVDLREAAFLVFDAKIRRIHGTIMNPTFLQDTFFDIWHKLPRHPSPEDQDDFIKRPPSGMQIPEVFRTTAQIGQEYAENPPPKSAQDMMEIDNHALPRSESKDRYSNYQLKDESIPGYKAGSDQQALEKISSENPYPFYLTESPLQMDVKSLFSQLLKRRKIVSYTGKGSRVKVISRSGGRYVYARKPLNHHPRSIAFDASIKSHFLHYPSSLKKIENVIFRRQTSEGKKKLAVDLNLDDIHEKINELRAPLSLYFIVDASASMRHTLPLAIKIIQSVHAEGYKKKDKVCVLSFQGRSVDTLQRPSVSLSVALAKLQQLQATSYTPLGSALKQTLTLISQEARKGFTLPIIIILSDMGANISLDQPKSNAATRNDFDRIASELDTLARRIGRLGYLTIIMKPLKSFATRYLGVDYHSVQKIERSFLDFARSQIYEYDVSDVDGTIMQFKKIVENYSN